MGSVDIIEDNTNQWASKCRVLLFGTLHTIYNTRVFSVLYKATKTTPSTSIVSCVTQNIYACHASLSEHPLLCHLVPLAYL